MGNMIQLGTISDVPESPIADRHSRKHSKSDRSSKRRSSDISVLSKLGVGFVLVVIIASLVVALLSATKLGWVAFLYLTAVSFVGGLAILRYIAGSGARRLETDNIPSETQAVMGAFLENPDPCVLIRKGKVTQANRAYIQLAKTLGTSSAADGPPGVDRIFGVSDNGTASTVFRLYHLDEKSKPAEEVIDAINAEGALRRYKIFVRPLGELQLWQIRDVTVENYGEESTLIGAPVGLFSIDRDGNVLATNDILNRWIGLTDKIRPKSLREFVQDATALTENEPIAGRVIRVDTKLITQKGIATPIIMTGVWSQIDNGDFIASVALYGHSSIGMQAQSRTVSAQSTAGKMVGLPNSVNQSFLAAPVAILELHGESLANAEIRGANPAFENMSQGVPWQGTAFSKFFETGSFKETDVQAAALTGEPFDAVLSGNNKIPVSIYIASAPNDPLKRWAYLVDISARKSLEDQLLQSQKMQAIGQLAAGVAHDFNNLLTTIRLNTDELLGRHPIGDPSYRELHDINTSVNRASATVKKLLAFSRKQTLRMEALNVTDTLSDLSSPLKQSLGERVKLNLIHGRGLPPIRGDKSQLDTVLLNLCVNARDAMESQGGGEITMTTSAVTREALEKDGIQNVIGDAFVLVAFADTGEGMPEDVKAKIFEPFYTTKEQGKGTGLGLATVYGIIEQSGGYLAVESALGVGTTFRIYLPVADKVDEDKVAVRKPVVIKPVDLTGQGTILFVEDEISVRTIAAKTLRKRGYKVIEAGDGEEAYEILEDGDYEFDLMISDVVMPSMDGPTLLKKGRPLLGDARIVFISGYAEEEFSELLSEEPDVTFLPKPFTLSELAEKVKSQIGESAP